MGALHGVARPIHAACDGVDQHAFLHAGAQVAEDDLGGVGGLARVGAAGKEIGQSLGFSLDVACRSEGIKGFRQIGEGKRLSPRRGEFWTRGPEFGERLADLAAGDDRVVKESWIDAQQT